MSQKFGDLAPSEYPGERLGLPEHGTGSVGRFGRRVVAIAIDWALASLPAYLLIGGPNAKWWHIGIFALLQMVCIPFIGGSFGHRLAGLHVVSLAGGPVGFWRPVVRTILLIAVIPLLVWDSDQRGFHDKVAGTVLIRT